MLQHGFWRKWSLFQSWIQKLPPKIILLQIRQVLGKIVFKNLPANFFIIFVALFNRELLKQNRNRVSGKFSQVDFIHQETAQIILQTIHDCKRNFSIIKRPEVDKNSPDYGDTHEMGWNGCSVKNKETESNFKEFESVLEIGARSGWLGKKLNAKNIIQTDLAINFHPDLVMDDENLCFKEQSFDLIISNLNLHFINDIPRNLVAIKKIMKPGGLFIASFFGEENLKELKEAFFQAEQEFYGGISPRIAPNIDIKTAGMLLQKAGFIDVVAEKHRFEVEYSHPKKLFDDLRNMGEANILNDRSRKFMTKNFLFNLTNLYQKLYCRDNNQYQPNSLATFEIIILTGWKK